MPLDIEAVKAKLRKNVELIKKYIPDFNPSEEQIENYISKERIEVHEKYENIVSYSKEADLRYKKAVKLIPGGIVPQDFSRISGPFYNTTDSPQAEAENRKIFSNLMRDDEIGERSRLDMFLKGVNSFAEFDPDRFGPGASLMSMVDYAYENRMRGVPAFTFAQFTDQSGLFSIKDAARKNMLKQYSEDIGSVVVNYPDYAATESFLTFPGELMTDGQLGTFIEMCQINPSLREELESNPDYAGVLDDAKTANTMITSIRELPASVENFRKNYLDKGYGVLTVDDIEFKEKNPAKRTMGGFTARMNATLELSRNIVHFTKDSNIPSVAALRKAAENWISIAEYSDRIPDENQTKAIVEAATGLARACTACRKDKTISSDMPQGRDFLQLSDALFNARKGLSSSETINSLIEYQKLDDAIYAETDSYGLMEKDLHELNEDLKSFMIKDHYGNDQHLTADDISGLGMKMTETLKHANDFLDALPEGASGNFIENVKLSIRRTNQMLKGVNHALPGQTLREVLDGSARKIDVTGHKFKVYGNALSGRKKMNLTSPDGSIVTGFFTERSTLDVPAEINRIAAKLKSQNPGLADKVEEIRAEFIKEPRRDEIEAFENAFLAGQDNDSELSKLYQTFKKNVDSAEKSRINYLGMIWDTTKSPIDTRNVALSDVADVLGIGNLIAKSVPMEIYDNGEKIQGTFMHLAEGESLDGLNKDSNLLKADITSMDNSDVLRQIADIQVLDFICGNVDRHGKNLIYKVNSDGKITGVTGIDNDMSFGFNTSHKMAHTVVPADMQKVSESLAGKVRTLSDEMLKNIVISNGLEPEAADKAVERLHIMQEAINNGTVEVIPDEQFKNYKVVDFLPENAMAKARNEFPYMLTKSLFGEAISSMRESITDAVKEKFRREREADALNPPAAKEKTAKKPDMVDNFEVLDQTIARQDIDPINDLITDVNRAQQHVFFGSSEFNRVANELRGMRDASELIGKNSKLATRAVYEGMVQGYDSLKTRCNEYLERKRRQGKLEAGGKTGRRIEAVRKVLKFAENKIGSIKKILTPELTKEEEIRQMKAESDKLQMEAFDKDHKLIGQIFGGLKEYAFKDGKLSKIHIQAADEVALIGKYMNDRKLSPEECGLTKADVNSFKTIARMGRLANAKVDRNVSEFKIQQADEPEENRKEIKLTELKL